LIVTGDCSGQIAASAKAGGTAPASSLGSRHVKTVIDEQARKGSWQSESVVQGVSGCPPLVPSTGCEELQPAINVSKAHAAHPLSLRSGRARTLSRLL
jgi:hypothetical protein